MQFNMIIADDILTHPIIIFVAILYMRYSYYLTYVRLISYLVWCLQGYL